MRTNASPFWIILLLVWGGSEQETIPVLSALFRRLLLERLSTLHAAGRLKFLGKHAKLTDTKVLQRLFGASAQQQMGGPLVTTSVALAASKTMAR
jgi:hypothetical protein